MRPSAAATGRAPADRTRLPQRLLSFDGCYSTSARGLGLIVCGREFGLSVRELSGQLIDPAWPARSARASARSRAAVRLLNLFPQDGRRFGVGGTFLRVW